MEGRPAAASDERERESGWDDPLDPFKRNIGALRADA